MIHTRRFQGRSIEQAMRVAKSELGEETYLLSAERVNSSNPTEVIYEVSVQAAGGPCPPDRARIDYSTLRRNLEEIANSLTTDSGSPDREPVVELSSTADPDSSHSTVELWTEEELSVRVNASNAIAVLGPAAVGKTTLCAKLLLVHGLQRGRECCWITVDSGWVGCGRMARFLASLLGVPCVSAEPGLPIPWPGGGSAGELGVIDLPSAGTLRDHSLDEYRSLLSSVRHVLGLFVVDARFSEASLDRAYEKFRVLNPAAVVANMADEAGSLHVVERFAARRNLPIALIGTGRSIPEDLVPASDYSAMRSLACRSSAVPAA